MRRLKPINKFFRRYEADLWGRVFLQRNNKTVRFLHKVYKEKLNFNHSPGKSFSKRKFKNKNLISTSTSINKLQLNKNILLKNNIKIEGQKQNQNRKQKQNKLKFNKIPKILKPIKRIKRTKRSFVYRIDVADPQRRRAKTSLSRELFLVKTKLLRFYNNIKKRQLRKYANTKTYKLKFKTSRGLAERSLLKYYTNFDNKKLLALNAFFSLIEHRVDIVLLRSGLVKTIRQARQLLNHSHVLVNGTVLTHSNFILNNFDIVSLDYKFSNIQNSFLKTNFLPLYPPKYILADYRLMCAAIISDPTINLVPFPFKIDLRKWLGLAKHMFK